MIQTNTNKLRGYNSKKNCPVYVCKYIHTIWTSNPNLKFRRNVGFLLQIMKDEKVVVPLFLLKSVKTNFSKKNYFLYSKYIVHYKDIFTVVLLD